MSDQTTRKIMLQELKRHMVKMRNIHKRSEENNILVKIAEENCSNPIVLKWLRENTFIQLVDMFNFLKKHIDEEEKKDHRDIVDVTIVAHGSIRDFMIPASCLLPLASIRDVVLYAPWNCVIYADVAYAVATGRLKPQHRTFCCSKKRCCILPDERHHPKNLPDHWNSMKKAGDQMIPNITLCPLKAPKDEYWSRFESLIKTHGPPGRNRIVIPFILPGKEAESVPFSVVTLALSLVLLESRFKATVHLDACLGDRSVGQKFDREYLEKQYCCAADHTGMTCSTESIFRVSLKERIVNMLYY